MPLIEFDNRGLEEISVDSLISSLVISSKLCDRALRNQFEGYRFLHMRPQTSRFRGSEFLKSLVPIDGNLSAKLRNNSGISGRNLCVRDSLAERNGFELP